MVLTHILLKKQYMHIFSSICRFQRSGILPITMDVLSSLSFYIESRPVILLVLKKPVKKGHSNQVELFCMQYICFCLSVIYINQYIDSYTVYSTTYSMLWLLQLCIEIILMASYHIFTIFTINYRPTYVFSVFIIKRTTYSSL